MVAELIGQHLQENQLDVEQVKRFWLLHQANLSMNHLIVRKLLGREASIEEAPVILDTYANTSSAVLLLLFTRIRMICQAVRWRYSARSVQVIQIGSVIRASGNRQLPAPTDSRQTENPCQLLT